LAGQLKSAVIKKLALGRDSGSGQPAQSCRTSTPSDNRFSPLDWTDIPNNWPNG